MLSVEKIDGKLMATGGRVLVCVGFGKVLKKLEIELMLYVGKYILLVKMQIRYCISSFKVRNQCNKIVLRIFN